MRIHVIGLGVGAGILLSRPAQQALAAAHTVIGSQRQLGLVRDHGDPGTATLLELPKLAELQATIEGLRDGAVCILASGDPLFYGIGRWLSQRFDAAQLEFYPAVSSIQAMCAACGLALQDCRVVSLHGRDLAGLRRVLKQNSDIVVLTDSHSHPQALAQACVDAGFEQSLVHVGEDLGGAGERYRRFGVRELLADDGFECSSLNVCVLQLRGAGGVLPEFPGIDDRAFASDAEPGRGMFTKREVRLAILALLQPGSADVIWDIGAGCGGVATELAHWNEQVSVYAIEQHPERLACLEENRRRFGCASNLHIVDGRAPQALKELPAPNKIFIGGSDGELDALLAFAWDALPAGGRLVVSAVTAATLGRLQEFAADVDDCETLQISVSHGEQGADGFEYRAKLPVTLFKYVKPGGAA